MIPRVTRFGPGRGRTESSLAQGRRGGDLRDLCPGSSSLSWSECGTVEGPSFVGMRRRGWVGVGDVPTGSLRTPSTRDFRPKHPYPSPSRGTRRGPGLGGLPCRRNQLFVGVDQGSRPVYGPGPSRLWRPGRPVCGLRVRSPSERELVSSTGRWRPRTRGSCVVFTVGRPVARFPCTVPASRPLGDGGVCSGKNSLFLFVATNVDKDSYGPKARQGGGDRPVLYRCKKRVLVFYL